MPNFTWGAPPYYASQMVYTNHLENSRVANVTATALPSPAAENLTVFGEITPDKTALVLRFVNNNNVSVTASFVVVGNGVQGVGAAWEGRDDGVGSFCSATSVVHVQTLTSPFFGTPDYDARNGGWNS